MNNRDYFTRPIQSGGRTAHDYGHNRITSDDEPRGDRFWWWLVIAVAIGIVMQVIR